ncbi:hypothetical protein E8E15_002269 [Penicillium rubens]|uniref:Agglutinin-like protein n=1 Tax=Penicillium chrysogenum TaxID=5076 RepID=A0A167VU85_PENCH|nr:uncharacterized protein N7525_004617 [Penicillium rubens]KAF3029194.1 hypothetical protein E8E15_002269 [Penicillium rubens]KAJ5044613.1 hypothetical protein NUH16_001419 [Penicillium rubens]KAJ5839429.1 hypothetical protein N7525_004617 [Penicillium rubens]KZN90902.1 Agglutinin-like protein [Penicillium chrysogenum]
MKHAVSWLSLLATVFGLVTTSDGSLINRAPALPAETEQKDGLTVTAAVGVTLWLGDGESCTAETITETSTQTGNVSPGATTITITEATTKTISGCRSGPTLSLIADVGIGPVDVSANAAVAPPGHGPIKTVTDYTTLTRTSCSCTDDSTATPTTSTVPSTTTSSVPVTTTSSEPGTTTSSVPGTTSATVPGTTSSSVPPTTTPSSPGTTTPTTSMTSDGSTTTPTETPTPTTTTVTTRTTSSSESVTTVPVSTTSVTTTGHSTVTIPNTTVTTVITEPATTVTISDGSSTLPGSTLTTTVTVPGSTVTVGDSTTITDTVTIPDSKTTRPVLPPSTATVTGPGTTSTQTSSSTTTVPASVCPSLISNPSYTPPAVLPDDYTWGCAPGYLCKPRHTGDRSECNVEAGLPDPGYVCSPSDCIVAPPLDVHPSWQYNVSKIYYNLNPEDFGLNYSIFQSSEDPVAGGSKRDMSLWDFAVAKKMKRADITNIPTVCFNDCNDAAHEPQVLGKTPELCESDSAFMENLDVCEQCITNNAESDSNQYSSQMLPTFAQWLNFCSDMVTSTTGESATSTEMETTATSTHITTTSSTEASTAATTTSTMNTHASTTKASSTETISTEATSTTTTATEERSSPVETTQPVTPITTSASGSIVTTSVSGSLVTTSFSGSVVTISTSGSLVTSSVPGPIVTTSVSGVLITTSLPGSIKTVPSTQGTEGGDENTSDNASRIPSSSVRISPTSSATPSTSSPAFNVAGSISIPHIGLMSLLWAAFAPLL